MWKVYIIIGLIITAMATIIIKQAGKNGELELANRVLKTSYEEAVKRTKQEQKVAATLAVELESLEQKFEDKEYAYQDLLEKLQKWGNTDIPVDITEWVKLLDDYSEDTGQ